MHCDKTDEAPRYENGYGVGIPAAHVQMACLVWILLCATGNFILGALSVTGGSNIEILFFVGFGFLGAQAALLAIWSVLGPWSLPWRLMSVVCIGTILFGSGWGGIAIEEANSRGFWEATGTTLLCLPLFVLAIQSPLWVARIWFGLQLSTRCSEFPTRDSRPLSLKDLMLGTAAAAVVFAAARLAKPEDVTDVDDFLVPIVIGAAIAGAISFCATIPTVFATHYARSPVGGLTLAIAVEALAYLALISGISFFESPPPRNAYDDLIVVFVSFVIFLKFPMLVSRLMGYRLLWGKQSRRTALNTKTTADIA